MARQKIKRYSITWRGADLDMDGQWCLWAEVAPYIKDVKNQRTTAKVRKPKRPAHV